jgi:hypothetical protein
VWKPLKQLSTIQLQQQIIHYKSELYKYQQRCKALENDFPVIKVTSLKNEISRLEADNEQLTKSISEWQSKYIEANETVESKTVIIKKQQSEYHKLQTKFQLFKEQFKKQKSLNLSTQDLQEQRLRNIQNLEGKIKELERKCIAYQIEGEYLKEEKQQLINERNFLKKWLLHTEICMIESFLDSAEKNKKFISSIKHNHEEQLLKQNKLDELKNLLESKDKQIQILSIQSKSNKEKITELETSLQNERKIKNEFASALRSLRIKIQEWKEHIQYERIESDPQTELSTREKDRYHTTIEHLQFENAKLIEEINQLKNKR